MGKHALNIFPFRRALPAICLAGGVLLAGVLTACTLSAAVCDKTADRIVTVDDLTELGTEFDCVIVLGCKVHADGSLSARLHDRVMTGIEVFEAGIGNTLLMSGDRQPDGNYDEVGAMRQAAIEAGVREEAVAIDPIGYSTYESMENLLAEYAGGRVVIVTQEYHLHRALYIAEKLGIDAYGVSADRQEYSDRVKCELREILARVKDVWYVQVKLTGMEA